LPEAPRPLRALLPWAFAGAQPVAEGGAVDSPPGEANRLDYYGKGYADIPARLPSIKNTTAELGWTPTTDMRSALNAIFDSYAHSLPSASALLSRDA